MYVCLCLSCLINRMHTNTVNPNEIVYKITNNTISTYIFSDSLNH